MSKLDDLLQTLCPNGVERVQVKKAFQRLRGTPITAGKMKEIEDPTGEIRIFAGGKTIINSKEKDIPNANITRVPAVLIQSRGVIDVVYYDKPFTFKNEMWAYTTENKTTVKYLYYVLKNNVQSFRDAASGMGSLPQISLPVTEDFYIPLPPLAVQQEIVRILDSFTELTTELNEKLTAELTARRKQYEHYRDELLPFGDDVPITALGNIAQVNVGSKPAQICNNTTLFEYINAGTGNSGYTSEANCDGDTVTTPSRGQGGIGYIGYQANPFWLGPLCYKIRVKSNERHLNKFLFYYLQSQNSEILKMKKEGGVPAINQSDLIQMQIPLLPIERQQSIVKILDRFDVICNDLTSGLPAEIAARQKQYEYYRDKLLTFKELEV